MAQPTKIESEEYFRPPFRTNLFPTSQASSPSESDREQPQQYDLRDFPVSFRDGPFRHQIKLVNHENLPRFLKIEFSLKRLDDIHQKLWVVGLPRPPRTLATHSQLGRSIVLTNDLDMHLVWGNGRIYLKPLPRYLLDPSFWETNPFQKGPPGLPMNGTPPTQNGPPLSRGDRAAALGLLYTYACLITHPSDMKLAVNAGLIPLNGNEPPDWSTWRRLAAELLQPEIITQAHRRFWRSELRLDRLNWIYLFRHPGSFRLYQRPWETYTELLVFSLSWIAAPILYIALVLNAMQVGLATNMLEENESFHRASYGFSIFTILAPLISAAVMVLLILIPIMVNAIVAWTAGRRSAGRMSAKMGTGLSRLGVVIDTDSAAQPSRGLQLLARRRSEAKTSTVGDNAA